MNYEGSRKYIKYITFDGIYRVYIVLGVQLYMAEMLMPQERMNTNDNKTDNSANKITTNSMKTNDKMIK